MTDLDLKMVVRALPYGTTYDHLGPKLLEGIHKLDLEEEIRKVGEATTPMQIETVRMNIMGSLRNVGFLVEGGRGGGKVYRIVGWQMKQAAVPASEWTGRARETLEWFDDLIEVTEERYRKDFDGSLLQVPHESAWLTFRSYEMAQAQGRIFNGVTGACIILRRFKDAPRFKIFNLSMGRQELLDTAEKVSRASTRPVKIIHIPELFARKLREIHASGNWEKSEQAMYSTHRIANDPEKFWSSSQRSLLRKHDRITKLDFRRYEEAGTVIKLWRQLNESKHRQLAIGRDQISVDVHSQGKIFLTGRRVTDDGLVPVSIMVLDRLPHAPTIAAMVTEKSLNYRSVPGGMSGTADWNLWATCKLIRQYGIDFINAGTFAGANQGLVDHKRRFSQSSEFGWTFVTKFPLFSDNL